MPEQEYLPSDVDWAWAAGLFEGEGHIAHRNYPKGHRAREYKMRGLVLGMCDEDVVRRFHRVVGAGRVKHRPPPKSHPHWSEQWRWECTRWVDVERILLRLLPHFGDRRRAKAEGLLADPAAPVGHSLTPQTHCKRGHEYTDENTYRYRSRRVCRACQRIRERKYRAKKGKTK